MAYYYSIPIEEMEEELESYRFYPVSLMYRNRPVKEWVYERKLPRSPNHFVRVYTGINRYGPSAGESRKSGKDAIRIQVIYRDTKGETLVSQPKRIHRVGGWRKNLKKRMDEVAKDLPQVQFDSRGEPMTLRKKGNSYFWGSRDYPKYKETKPFRAEGGNPVIRFDTLEEFHNYVKEHPYYDVEYAKRRVLMRAESREEFQQFSQTQPVIILDFECYAWRGLKADTIGVAYNHVVPLSNVSFQNLGGNLLPRDLIKEYGEPQSAAFIFNQDYQERNSSIGRYGYLQNMKINLKGIPFSINWSWSHLEKLELWLWKIPINSIENKDELNFTDIVKLNPIKGQMWNHHQKRREMYASEDRLDYRDYLNDLRTYPELKNLSDEQLLARGIDCLALQTANRESFGAESEDEIPIIDLNSKKEIEQYGMFESYDPVVHPEERKRRESLENNNFFRINCDGVYAVRAIWGPSKVMYGRNMLASNKVSFNKSQQVHLSKVWEKLGLPRYNSGVVSAYGPLRRKSRLPKYMKPNWGGTSRDKKNLNIIVINMKGLVFAYDSVHQEIEFYGGVPESSIVSQDIPPEVVKVNNQYEMAEPQEWGHSIRENAKDYESLLRRYGGKNSRRFRQGLKGEIDVPDEEYISYWKQFAAEDIVIADFKNMSAAEIQTYAPDNWKIVMYWAADGSTYILRRIFKTESYGEVVDLIDEINLIASELNHHPMVTFDKERVMIQLWTHDVHNITELDIAFAELLNQFADKWELNAESPDWEDIDWKTDKPPAKKGPEDWGDDVEWDAESYLERDKRLWEGGRWYRKMGKHENPNVKPKVRRYNSIDEFYAHKKSQGGRHWRDRAAEVSVFNFDYYVKRTMKNPIATLYNRIIPLGNLASGYSNNFGERNNHLIKRYGAPLYASALWMPNPNANYASPTNKPTKKGLMKFFRMKKWDEDTIVRETGDPFIGIHTPSALVSDGKKRDYYNEKRDVKNETALLINLKGLKITNVGDHGGAKIMIWGGIPLSSIVGHFGAEPRFVPLAGEQHWQEQLSAEDEEDEITLKEFDETTADDFVKDSDEQIALMLRNKSKINRNGDIGCPVCGSIGLFYEEIIAKGKKWYCYNCLYEDKEETIKGKGDITLEKYGLEITCPICKKGIKAFNNDSMLRHMKKCGVSK